MDYKGKGKMICGCGTCGDAIDAALRLTRSDIGSCGVWWLAVSRVIEQIALQRVLMQMVALSEKQGVDVIDPKVVEDLRAKAAQFGGSMNDKFDKAVDHLFYMENSGPFLADACEGYTDHMPRRSVSRSSCTRRRKSPTKNTWRRRATIRWRRCSKRSASIRMSCRC